ncbi:MAG TPA: CCA tRNA nucleotidyltransferase [Coleofasciculaceae cyanobacterium]
MPDLMIAAGLDPSAWPIELTDLPETAYLVGGAVRDALLGRRRSVLDLDVVLEAGAIDLARTIAGRYGAGFVVLDRERQIARVVFPSGTLDVAVQVGGSIERDLWRRDFTINAIAYQPHRGEWVDPLGGRRDLAERSLRMVALENLIDDPLRLLRAYRLSAQLDFAVEPATAAAIAQQVPNLKRVAAERVRAELDYLLETPRGDRALLAAAVIDLWRDWLPALTERSRSTLVAIHAAEAQLRALWPAVPITDPLPNGRSPLAAARLACLLGPDLTLAQATLDRLKTSRLDHRILLAILAALASLPPTTAEQPLDLAGQYAFCKAAGVSFPAAALLAIAQGTRPAVLAEAIGRWQDPSDRVAHPHSPLTGDELMAEFAVPRGPIVGRLLAALERAQAVGQVDSPESARRFAQQWLQNSGF